MRDEDKTREQFVNELAKLRQRVAELEVSEAHKKDEEAALRKLSHDLGERVKELNCLYGISKILEKPDISLEEILQRTAGLIPPAWQYPEITCARVTLEGQEFRTERFEDTIWKQTSDIIVHNDRIGTLEVSYLEERPESDEGPFLKEERSLINAIAERLGRIIERKRADEALQEYTHDLGERVKELNCLYGISKILEKPDISLEEILQRTAGLIPPAWQYPEIICARVTLEGQEFRTERFEDTIWKQTSDIIVHGDPIGVLDVCYLEEKPEADEGPFLKEEGLLINAVAERLGRIIEQVRAEEELTKHRNHLEDLVKERTAELTTANQQLQSEIAERKQAEEELRASENRYRILTENVADGVGILQDRKFVFVNDALASILGYTVGDLVGIDPFVLFRDDHKERFKELLKKLENGIPVECFQAPCIRGDGREIWVDERHSIIQWEGKTAVLATMRDITESKLREIGIEEDREHLRGEYTKLRATLKDRYKFCDIIGKSSPMQGVYELILQTSGSDANVVIYGESGTGKELIARTIHDMSDRAGKLFVPVNCGAVPEALFESEFFGHRKGAFTGAHMDKHGFFDLAHRGSLFLDEVGELTPNMQVKLLRAIEGGGYNPVGGTKVRKANVRIITATNGNLADMVKKGLFREDFFYRLHVIPITIPPLRDRKEDIPLLVDHFLKLHGDGKGRQTISGEIFEALRNHDWPGNVRELENVLKRYLTIKRLDFIETYPAKAGDKGNISNERLDKEGQGPCETLEAVQKRYISKVLEQNHWHRAKTAMMLHVPERTLYRKLKKFELI